MNKKWLCNVFIFIGLSYTINAQAQRILPEFSGSWYQVATPHFVDACQVQRYQYTPAQGREPYYIAKEALTNPETARAQHCVWSEPHLVRTSNEQPIDYPADPSTWDQILATSGNARVSKWQAECVDEANHIQATNTISLSPRYACPTNSRLSKIDGSWVCTDEPNICVADVMARELDAMKSVGFLGHIGMTFAPERVLEVFDDVNVVRVSSVDKFKKTAKFWGEKYGNPDSPELSAAEADKIIQYGLTQAQFDPRYTLTWQWREGQFMPILVQNPQTGQWQTQMAMQRASLRCDGFIYLSYLHGANRELKTAHGVPMIPTTMFANFEQFRFPNDGKFTEAMLTTQGAKEANLMQLDTSTRGVVLNRDYDRLLKLKGFWDAMRLNSNDSFRFRYFLDLFINLKPFEYTDNLLQYYQDSSLDRQREILNVLRDLLVAEPVPDQQTWLVDHTPEVNKILAFYQMQLEQTADSIILQRTILDLQVVLPREVGQPLLARGRARLAEMTTDAERDTRFWHSYILNDLSQILADDEVDQIQQITQLQNVIPDVYQQKYLPQALCFVLQANGADHLTDDTKQWVTRLLQSHQTEQVSAPSGDLNPPCQQL